MVEIWSGSWKYTFREVAGPCVGGIVERAALSWLAVSTAETENLVYGGVH